jgi:hypothetical protein
MPNTASLLHDLTCDRLVLFMRTMTRPSDPHQLKSKDSVALVLTFFAICCVLIAAVMCRQRIFDWVKLRDYTPPSSVAQLASEDTMNSYTTHVFYVNHPKLLATVTSFRKECPSDEADIILGCYHVGQNGIFIYSVKDQALAGVQQVTAAHEVLHAIYARLSPSARMKLNGELEAYYKYDLKNSRVKAEIAVYQQTEPGSVYDEMSCTFGTEIAQLPADLDAYYSQFFTNRAAIVGYEQQYEGVVTSRQNQITADDQQLTSLSQQIQNQQKSLATQLTIITAQRSALSSLESTNAIEYNQSVPSFNALVSTYNADVTALQTTENHYNQLLATRNSIAGEFDTLIKAIDTRVTPQKTTSS